MKKLITITITVTCALMIISGCKPKLETKEIKKGPDSIAVNITSAYTTNLAIEKIYPATLEGGEQANVIAKIPERIVAIPVKIGSTVKAGQVVINLDKAGASSQYFQAEAALQNASRDLERMRALLKEGAISQQMFDGAQTQYNIAKANFEAAKSVVDITAPISGTVTALNYKIGDNANPATPLLVIAQTGTLKAIMNIGEADIAYISPGKQVTITTDINPTIKITGRISEIAKSADAQSRSFEVKALFPNTGKAVLFPGMFCKVTIALQSKMHALVVPVQAVTTHGDKHSVFIVNNGKAELRDVIPGLNNGSVYEILQGLHENEFVVTTGIAEIQNGSLVKVQHSEHHE
ncbi:MAG: efflux RND transporter periplasmic adaptor subunit [Ignavibacteria bacterium]|nr:efflux RND transporter periplasmic adaptor subunit [Ignavibacteria bacterium]